MSYNPLPLGQNTMANSVPIVFSSNQTSNTMLGVVSGTSDVIETIPVLDTSAYANGDVLFLTTQMANVFLANGGKALLHSVIINDKDDLKETIELLYFNANVSLGNINSAPNITDADADKIIARVSVVGDDWLDLGGCSIAVKSAIGQVVKTASNTNSLWIAGISRRANGSHTSTGLTIKSGFADRS